MSRPHAFTFPFILLACNTVAGNSEKPAPETPSTLRVETTAATAAPAGSSQNAQLTLVERPSEVCMVNDQFMGREQIPVEVDGKTYFGCCEMCKGRLARDASARVAKDPVSGNSVDKATAVIAKRANRDVVYFESAATFDRYRAM
jgi:YHS domain-containing protein